jgi:hypothetical protein
LRKSFSNILKNKSHLNNELVEYMMGHALPYNSAYNEPDPNDIRELYKSVEKLLSPSEGLVVENGGTVEELRQEFDQKLKNTLKDFLTYLDEMQVIHNVALPREFKLKGFARDAQRTIVSAFEGRWCGKGFCGAF